MLKCARIFVRRDYTFRKVSDSEARGTVQCLWINLKLFFVSTESYYVSYLSFVLKAHKAKKKKLNCLQDFKWFATELTSQKKLFRNKYVQVDLFKLFITKLILRLLSLPKICWHLHESLDMTAFYLKNAAFMYTKVITIEFPLI